MLKSINFWRSLSVILLGALVATNMHFIKPPGGRGPNITKISDKLELTTSQSESLKKVFKKNKEEHTKLRKQVHLLDQSFQEKMNSADYSTEDVEKSFMAVDEIKKEMAHQRFKMTLEIRKVVGADKMKVFKMMGPGGKRGPGKHGHRPPPPHDEH